MKGVLYISFLVCILLGCTDSDGLPNWQKDNIVRTELEIASAAIVEDNAQTRADVPFTSGSSIALFCHGQTVETSYVPMNNKKYTLIEGSAQWTAVSEASTIYLGGEKADVCGYYPYKEGVAGTADTLYNNRTTIPMDTQDYDPSKELYYVTNQEVDAKNCSVNMRFKHAYSRLILNIGVEDAYPANCSINSVALANDSLFRKAVIDITSGTVGIHPDDTEKQFRGGYNITKDLPYVLDSSTKKYQADLLMIPTKLLPDPFEPTKGLSVIVNVSGFPATVTIPITDLSDFESGKKYVVSLRLRGIAIKTVTVTTTDWDEKVLNEGIDYEPLPQP